MSTPEAAPQRTEPQSLPVQPDERLTLIDVLRGFAVFGILAANMYSFSGAAYTPAAWSEPLDRAIVTTTRFLVEAKFYSLFSFLFGWGMAVQMLRAEARGLRFVPRYLWRLLLLFAIGLLHATLLWTGDIVARYALYGFVLLLFRKRSARFLLASIALSLGLSILLAFPGEAMDAVRNQYTLLTDFLRSSRYSPGLYTSGSYLEVTRLRSEEYLSYMASFLYSFGNVFAMFLLGLLVGKQRIFKNLDQHLPRIRRLTWLALGVGLVFTSLHVWSILHPDWVRPENQRLAYVGSRTIGAPFLMLFYVGAITLLYQREPWRIRLAPLANVGRMALTNYLLQSFTATLIFYGYGIGLYGRTDPTFGLILTVLIFLAEVRFSEWWFERYQYGPVEWVWRTLTYGRRPPLRDGGIYAERTGSQGPGRRFAGIHPLLPLAGVWVVLLLWALALLGWSARQRSEARPFPIVSQVTATPNSSLPPGDGLPAGASGQTPGVPFPPQTAPLVYNPGPLAATGDAPRLAAAFDTNAALDQIEALANPAFQGRYGGSPGGQAAGDYLADQFARIGLQPAGDEGTFFQEFPVVYTPLASNPTLVVMDSQGVPRADFVLHRDFSPLIRMYSGMGSGEGSVIWVEDCSPEDFVDVDVEGRIVLCAAEAFGPDPNLAGRYALEHGAAGLLLLTDPAERPADFGYTFDEPWVPAPLPVLRVYPAVAESLLLGSGYGLDDLLAAETAIPLDARARLAVAVETGACPVSGCQGRNVLGVLPGRDPAAANEVVILGAHYDHLGQGPDGTIWPGANDNASGVAVLLEIARTWQAQGYVPRRTVVFAAWDAEEQGLLGSIHYVTYPRYPLEDTAAMLQLDMVGAGAGALALDGEPGLLEHLLRDAETLAIPTAEYPLGRSDHVPFLEAGVPAGLLIWWDPDQAIPHYHRPGDTPAVIDAEKLAAAGQLAGLTLLDIAESEPAIRNLLAARLTALATADLNGFLATSSPDQETADRLWFTDLQSFSPVSVTLDLQDLQVTGDTARGRLQLKIGTQTDSAVPRPAIQTVSLDALFRRLPDGWRWAGPYLEWDATLAQSSGEPPAELQPALAVAHPPEQEAGWAELGRLAAEKYAAIAGRLGLPAVTPAALMVFPNATDLQVATALSLPDDLAYWAAPGVLKLVYTEEISRSLALEDGLAQLVLANNGVPQEAAPWLWEGLPLAIQAEMDPVALQTRLLPGLQTGLKSGDLAPRPAFSWAAVDHLVERLSWEGLGQFIADLGQVCQAGGCADTAGLDAALGRAVGQDSQAFEAAWRSAWGARLDAVQAGLDRLLAARTAAALAGDPSAFAGTVDPAVPHLQAEARSWLAALQRARADELTMAARPLALLDDGSVLARVELAGHLLATGGSPAYDLDILFTPGETGFYWAGPRLETLAGELVSVRYPPGQDALARDVLATAASLYRGLAARLEVAAPAPLAVTVYENPASFRASIALDFPLVDWARAWTAPGEGVKLLLDPDQPADTYQPDLAMQLARSLLQARGVKSEWLLRGLSVYLARPFDGGAAQQTAAAGLPVLLEALDADITYDLASMLPDHTLSEEDFILARAQAWDSVRYLIDRQAPGTLDALLARLGQGDTVDAALTVLTGQGLAAFQEAWAASFTAGHIRPEWIEMTAQFDEAAALIHVNHLAAPALEGRSAGSPGEAAAARYIAEQFAALGLLPAGDTAGVSFLQPFPITRTIMLAPPEMHLFSPAGEPVLALTFRADFQRAALRASRDIRARRPRLGRGPRGAGRGGRWRACCPPVRCAVRG